MIRAVELTRHYRSGDREVHAVRAVSFTIERHEFVAITGPSGCGKSTLLHLLGGLDRPSAGELHVDDLALHAASDDQLTRYRRETVGVVFQFFNLMPTMTLLENVALPLLLDGARWREAHARARQMIELVGLAPRAAHFPHQLSGGEQQRSAIARALVQQPELLLADEPTGNLDSAAAAVVLDLLETIAREKRATLIVITHSEAVAGVATRRLRMQDGRIAGDSFA
jgi:putative ABC transport system ATP-binding protein